MSTKTEERKALQQISDIVRGLGSDSYIATAFAGCWEIAEQNIANDWACSMKDRAESAERKAEEMEVRLAAMKKTLDGTIKELTAATERATSFEADFYRMQVKWTEATTTIRTQELEIMKLKARIFDLMELEKD